MTQNLKRPIRKAVFPVAGLGTRFLPATKVLPKEMLPLVDRPLIQRAVEEAQEAGIEEFIFVSGRGKSLITQHFEIQPELNDILRDKGKDDFLEKVGHSDIPSGKVQITMQQHALGLGHAVWCAKNLVGDEPFAVFLVDVMTLGPRGCMAQMMHITHMVVI
jgi:UTP--glucose-1-phosphate uridylyltransferase